MCGALQYQQALRPIQALRAEINPYPNLYPAVSTNRSTGSRRPRRFGAKRLKSTQPMAAAGFAATIELRVSAIITT
jgi:hypothetical protein